STDNSIKGSEAITAQITGLVQHDLVYLAEHITRIEVHLSDANADKSGPDDIKCVLEARLKGQQPMAVTASASASASALEQATRGAVGKMKSALESTLGKLTDHR
ncbi:MAG: ribosomal subunit interface protein, partial [Gammaproteobacteria bacterium SHHR-1]